MKLYLEGLDVNPAPFTAITSITYVFVTFILSPVTSTEEDAVDFHPV
jgi:hypothetical protein